MARARELFPGGVNSPVRAFRGVGGEPFVVERGAGRAHLGRRRQRVHRLRALVGAARARPRAAGGARRAATRRCGAARASASRPELEVAARGAGRRADAARRDAALRLERHRGDDERGAPRARARPAATCILKFDGCYHGHARLAFSCAPAPASRRSACRTRPACRTALAALTLTAPFNDLDAVERAAAANGDRVAAIIVEPVVGNAGFIPPDPAFLPGLRALADEHGALLIFDEVMTGFRVAYGGARERFGVTADLTTLGKVIGGGLPVAAYGGRRDLMEQVAPSGPVYQAGTLSGNPNGDAGL